MDDRHEQSRQQPQTQCCYRHADRETGIRCTRCDRPICTECMIAASVGFQCPECVRGGSGTGHAPGANQPRTLAGGLVVSDTRLVTKVLLALNVALFVTALAGGNPVVSELYLLGRFPAEPFFPAFAGLAAGEWYRLLTSMFLHEAIWHIGFNMLALWFLGAPLEAALGRLRFLVLYLLSGLAGGALTYVIADPAQPSLGASGAIFGLFGAMAVLVRRLNYDMRPIVILLAINLVFTFARTDIIAWEAHVGGLVAGAAIGYAMVHAPRDRRTLVQAGSSAAVLLVIIAMCVVRTLQLAG